MKKILLLVAVIAASFSLNAQRTIDMETSIVAPADGSTFRSGEAFTLSYTFKNNGPDSMVAGDTIVVNILLNNVNQSSLAQILTLNTTILKDSSVTINRPGLNITAPSAGARDLCVVGRFFSRVTTDFVQDTTITGNNRSCVNLNITVGLGDELSAKKLNANAYPNPMSSAGVISFTTTTSSEVSVKIFDLAGRQVLSVFEGTKEAGDHTANFNVSDLKDGIYLYQIQAGDISTTNKLIIRK